VVGGNIAEGTPVAIRLCVIQGTDKWCAIPGSSGWGYGYA
jgi:hypothetical protein